jgi:hypothetical protein
MRSQNSKYREEIRKLELKIAGNNRGMMREEFMEILRENAWIDSDTIGTTLAKARKIILELQYFLKDYEDIA